MSIMDLIKKGKKDREKKVRVRALKNAAIGAAIGTTLGAVAGVFLAPKSGKENREDLINAAKEIPEKAKEMAEKAKEKVEEVKEKIKEKTTKKVEEQEIEA